MHTNLPLLEKFKQFRAKTQDPAFDFIQARYSESDFQAAVRELAKLLAFVPDLLPYPPCPAGGDSDLYRVKLIMHDLEAVAHEIGQVEIFGRGKPLIVDLEHLYPVQDEHPHFSREPLFTLKIKPHLFLRNGIYPNFQAIQPPGHPLG